MDRDGGNKERMRKCREWFFLHFHPEALSSMNMLQNLFRFIESLRTALSDSESRYVWFWQCSSTFKMQPSEINLAFSEPWMASLAVLIHWLVRLAYIFATRPSRHWRKVQWLFHQYCFAMQCKTGFTHIFSYLETAAHRRLNVEYERWKTVFVPSTLKATISDHCSGFRNGR